MAPCSPVSNKRTKKATVMLKGGHHEIAERTEKYTFINVGNKRGCGLWSRREQWRGVERGEEREGGVSIQPRRCFRYVGTLGLLGTRQTLPSYYCELSQRKKEI